MNSLKNTADLALELMKKDGADKAKVNVGDTITHEFNVDGGKFSLFRTLFDKHLVMTAIKDGKVGTVRQNRYDEDTVRELSKTCLQTASSASPDPCRDIAPLGENKDFEYGQIKPDLDKLFFRCKELMEDIKVRFPKIMMEQMIVSHKEQISVHANTNGVVFGEHCGHYEISLMFNGHDGERTSSFFGSGVITENLDTPFVELGSIAKDLHDVEKQIETEALDGKFEGVMLLSPACFAEFLQYALENFVGGGSLLEGKSPWKDKLGQKVVDERINISVSPLSDNIVCGERVTSDGFASENYDIIKDGVLLSFMTDLYVANKTGNKRSPNGSYNVIVDGGEKKLDNIISSIEKGIVVGRFSGGEPASNGDFSGVAKNSFLIENGKVTKALSETMISGNIERMLNNVNALSDERICDGMTMLPYAAFNGITVSGK